MNAVNFFPYLTALLLTIIIEGILCWFFFKNCGWLRFTCLVNLFTNPLANALYAAFFLKITFPPAGSEAEALFTAHHQFTLHFFLLLLELAVWLLEAWLFYLYALRQGSDNPSGTENPVFSGKSFSRSHALFVSLCLNAASCLTGVLLQL